MSATLATIDSSTSVSFTPVQPHYDKSEDHMLSDEDDEILDDDDSNDQSRDSSYLAQRSTDSDPSKFRLEINVLKNSDTSTTDTNQKPTHSKIVLSNETLWDIFDLVFECENYKHSLDSSSSSTSTSPLSSSSSSSTSSRLKKSPPPSSASRKIAKIIYTPEFREQMKHEYNLIYNDKYLEVNNKFENSIWSKPSWKNDQNPSSFVSQLLPCITSGSIQELDKISNETDDETTTELKKVEALRHWLKTNLATELAHLWESLEPEHFSDFGGSFSKHSLSKIPSAEKVASYEKEIDFIQSINRDLEERKKLMDGIVVDLASIVSIGSNSGTSPNSNNNQMTTMGPLLAAKMVADTLPIAFISQFIPYLSRFLYAQNAFKLNSLIINELKDVLMDAIPLPERIQKKLVKANDFYSVLHALDNSTGESVISTSRSESPASGESKSSVFAQPRPLMMADKFVASLGSHHSEDVNMENSDLQSTPSPVVSSNSSFTPPLTSTPTTSNSRLSISIFPNNNPHRRTSSLSFASGLITPVGTTAPNASFSTTTASSASSDSEPKEVDEQRLIGPLLSPLVTLNIISPNLDTLYPDYLSFLHVTFGAWTNFSALSSFSSSTSLASAPLGTASTATSGSPGSLSNGVRSAFAIPESIKISNALGGIYLTLINHPTTHKVPAILEAFSQLQHQITQQQQQAMMGMSTSAGKLQVRDLDNLKNKLVGIYNEWVQTQPLPRPVKTAGSASNSRRTSGVTSRSGSASSSPTGGVKKLSVQNTSRVGKKPSTNGKSSTSASDRIDPEDLKNNSSDSIKRRSRGRSISSNGSSSGNTAAAPPAKAQPSLPATCTKCFHNHKGNNCARKCYVCRMAKLAAQHGHVVKFLPGPGQSESSGGETAQSPSSTGSNNDSKLMPAPSTPTPIGNSGNRNASNNSNNNNNNNNGGSNRQHNNGHRRGRSQYTFPNEYGNTSNSHNSSSGSYHGNSGSNRPSHYGHGHSYSHSNNTYNGNSNGGHGHNSNSHGGGHGNNRNNYNNNNNNNEHQGQHRRNPSAAANSFASRLNLRN